MKIQMFRPRVTPGARRKINGGETVPFLVNAVLVFLFFLCFAGKNFYKLWIGGFIGVCIVFVTDSIGYFYNLYYYRNGLLMLWGYLPVLHLFNVFISSMLYLNWLPAVWSRRILYTVYVSVLFLAIEGLIHEAGGIIYPNWSLGHSYFLINGGLLLLAYLSDIVKGTKLLKRCSNI